MLNSNLIDKSLQQRELVALEKYKSLRISIQMLNLRENIMKLLETWSLRGSVNFPKVVVPLSNTRMLTLQLYPHLRLIAISLEVSN
jgi:hypothetical protein